MHYNFTAFDEFEIFSSNEEKKKYRQLKINEVQKNISFVKKHFDKKIDVLENETLTEYINRVRAAEAKKDD